MSNCRCFAANVLQIGVNKISENRTAKPNRAGPNRLKPNHGFTAGLLIKEIPDRALRFGFRF